MSLRIRRGTDAERQTVTFLEGELVYTTDTKKVYVGDGSTLGGNSVDTSVGSIDNLSDVNIAGIVPGQVLQWNGAAFIPGNRDKESVFGDDSTLLVDTINSAIVLDGTVRGHIVPDQNIAYDLGSTSNRFRDLYLSGTTIDLGGTTISVSGGKINFSDPVQAEVELSQNMDLKNYYITSTDTNPDVSLRPGTNGNMNVSTVGGAKKFEVNVGENWFGAPATSTAVLQLPVFGTADYGTHTNTDLGQVVFDNPTKQLKVYNGVGWTAIGGGSSGSGIIEGMEYSININGNVVADDSTIIVNAATSVVEAQFIRSDNIEGTVTGTLQGHVIGADSSIILNYSEGNFYGNVSSDNGDAVVSTGATRALSTVNTGTIIADVINGDVNGDVNGNVTGSVNGDLLGSVFTDNSTLVIDGITGNVSTDRIISDFMNIGTASNAVETYVNIRSTDESNVLRFQRASDSDISASALKYGEISFGRDDVGGPVETIRISGFQDGMTISHSADGNHSTAGTNLYVSDGKFGFGTFAPATNAKVDVAGNLHITAGYTQFGSLTSTERNALTPANGMVIYNTTNNKFEGYQNGGWINLDDGLAAS